MPVVWLALCLLPAGLWALEPCSTGVCESSADHTVLLQTRKEGVNTSGSGSPSVIPKIVFVTAPDSLEAGLVERLKANIAADPDIRSENVFLYNDETMAQSVCRISKSLKDWGVPGVYEAFSSLRPGAFRADLWRYMALWDHGGVYMDMDLRLHAPLDQWIDFDDDRLVLVKDRPPNAYWNALMASPARHPGLLEIIQSVTQHVRQHFYGKDALELTGPVGFFAAMHKLPGIDDRIKVNLQMEATKHDFCGHDGQLPCPVQVVTMSEPKIVVASENFEAKKTGRGPLYYNTLFEKHEVYCSENGPACNSLPPCN